MKRIKCDLGSAYPKMAIAFALDPSNYIAHADMPFSHIAEQEIADVIKQGYSVWSKTEWGKICVERNIIPIPVTFRQTIEELQKIKEYKQCDFTGVTPLRGVYYFKQNTDAILCRAFDAPMKWKQELKIKLKGISEDDPLHKVAENEYDSSKRLGNSGFGICGNKYNRLFKLETFNSITFLVRDLLLYLIPLVKAKGFDIIFIDTDSFVVEADNENFVKTLNGWIQDWAMDRYGNTKVDIRFEYEGYFISLYVGGKCLDKTARILTDKGNIFISKIYENPNNYKVASINIKNQLEYVKIKKIWKTPLLDRKLYKVRNIYLGQKKDDCGCIMTEDHPILTKDNGWQGIKNIKETDLIHTGTLLPSKDVREFIVGSILGDSYLKDGKIYLTHSIKQKNYCLYKIGIISDNQNTINESIDKQGYKKIKYVCPVLPYYKFLENKFYKIIDGKRKKIITKEILGSFSLISLAVLFMDDGYIRKTRQFSGEIASCCFTKEENELLSQKIKELGIDNSVIKKGNYYRINFNSEQIKILCKKIAPYIPNCMEYKLYPEFRNIAKIEIDKISKEGFFAPVNIKLVNKKVKEVYDLELVKNHNFITFAGLTHNCRYMGYLVKPNGDIKEEIKGLEIKRKNSTIFQKVEQKAFFKYLLDGHTFDEIMAYIEEWIQRLYNAPLTEVGSPRKIAKPREEYKNKAQLFTALDNTQKIKPSFVKEIGEKFYIMFVKTESEILAFDEKNIDLVPKEIVDYPTLLEKQIFNILVPVFAGLNWGEDLLKLAEKHNVLLESAQRNTLLEEYDNYEELKKYFSANEVKKRKPGYIVKVVKTKKVKDLTKS